jgi:hypothetical protein
MPPALGDVDLWVHKLAVVSHRVLADGIRFVADKAAAAV